MYRVLPLRLEGEYKLFETLDRSPQDLDWLQEAFSQAWAEMVGMGRATNQSLIHLELRAQDSPVSMHLYLMFREAWDIIRPHVTSFLEQWILCKCQLSWNTPILTMKKSGAQN